jgi:signal transduction histidine kinase
MKLATRITFTLVGVIILGALGSAEALLVARRMAHVLDDVVSDNVSSVRAAEELEIALLEQRGLVSSHILDRGNPKWLGELQDRKASFGRWMTKAEGTAHTEEERTLLRDLRQVYAEYDGKRDEVIRLFEHGEEAHATAVLLNEVNSLYRRAYAICEEFLSANERFIDQRSNHARVELRRASVIVAAFFLLTILSGAAVFLLFFQGVLRPLRQMADDARQFTNAQTEPDSAGSPQDELRAVGFYLRSLMSNVAEAQTHLDRSRDQLINAEKLSSLGRLGASICHEIRNPLTAIEMHLFSIRQAVSDRPDLESDFEIVSEQIEHLENTVHSFLEFSRPPRPSLKTHDVNRLLDKTLELCGRWLTERGIKVVRQGDDDSLPVMVDAEQIKQVFLNLLRNSAEAMVDRGAITITTALESSGGGREMVVVRVEDSGPGIPAAVRERILEPFFSTKPDGTGLGLCIAARIMAQHEGRLELEPPSEQGTCFAVWIPAAREA